MLCGLVALRQTACRTVGVCMVVHAARAWPWEHLAAFAAVASWSRISAATAAPCRQAAKLFKRGWGAAFAILSLFFCLSLPVCMTGRRYPAGRR